VSLRDELNRRLTDFDLDVSEDFIDTLLPWLEQKLTEAQAETKRIIICVWCGQTIERTGDIKVDVKASQAHDASCEKNPVRRQAQAEMIERCLCHVYEIDSLASGEAECLCGCRPDTAIGHDFEQWKVHVRALSPDPHARERWERTAYIKGVKSVYVQHDHAAGVCGAACPLKLRDLRVAELERQLAALPKGARQ